MIMVVNVVHHRWRIRRMKRVVWTMSWKTASWSVVQVYCLATAAKTRPRELLGRGSSGVMNSGMYIHMHCNAVTSIHTYIRFVKPNNFWWKMFWKFQSRSDLDLIRAEISFTCCLIWLGYVSNVHELVKCNTLLSGLCIASLRFSKHHWRADTVLLILSKAYMYNNSEIVLASDTAVVFYLAKVTRRETIMPHCWSTMVVVGHSLWISPPPLGDFK